MSECIRPHLRDCPTCAHNGRCDAQDATSLERKPLDGYDWLADLAVLLYPTLKACSDPDYRDKARARLAAYIESLEADMDALVEGRAK
jgi:hypothetical protein